MPPIELLVKPSSGMCNLQCTYCFYRDIIQNRENSNYGFMTYETLENVIKKAFAYAEGFCSIAFQGGEPTLIGIDFYRKVLELQKRYNVRNVKVYNSIQTNGYHVNEEWAELFKKNDFLVGLSLDGIKKTHDRYRRDRKGEGTFTEIMELTDLFDRYQVKYNILTVVNEVTAKRVSEIYQFYRRKGFDYLQFIPCLDPIGACSGQNEYSLDAVTYGEFLQKLFYMWYQDYLQNRIIHIREFENYIQILAGYPAEACGMNGKCSIQNVVEADGTVYPCDFYALDSYRLGNLNHDGLDEIRKSSNALRFIEEAAQPEKKCVACKYYQLCRGGCRRYRDSTAQGNIQMNKFCRSYEMFFDSSLEQLTDIAKKVKSFR